MSQVGVKRGNVSETLIGAIVVAVAIGFIIFAYMRTGTGSLSGYELLARLPQVDGLGVGTDVRLAGIKIGSISDLTLDPKTYMATVHMSIREDIKIPTDSSLKVTSAGILGSSYLAITPGGDEAVMKPGASFANAQGSIDVMGLVGRFIGGGNGDAPKPAPQAPQQLPPSP